MPPLLLLAAQALQRQAGHSGRRHVIQINSTIWLSVRCIHGLMFAQAAVPAAQRAASAMGTESVEATRGPGQPERLLER